MFKVIWSVFQDKYIIVKYDHGMILPMFDGSFEDCQEYIQNNLS
jgi:hypothetical protein